MMSIKKMSRISYTTVKRGGVDDVVNKHVSVSPSIETAHAVMARSYELKSRICCYAAIANAPIKDASACPTAANDHAVLASPCGLKSPTCRYVAVANSANSEASFWPAVVNAHAVLARLCGLKSPMRCSAAYPQLYSYCSL